MGFREGTVVFDTSVSQVLWVCEKAQFACADLYHFFAAHFKDDRKIFHLWLMTAMEEENRARLFALMAKLRHDNIIASVELELAEAEETLQHVLTLVQQAKGNPPSLVEALEIGLELESKMNRLMRENVVKFADESCEKSFVAMTNIKHLEELQVACQELAVSKGEP